MDSKIKANKINQMKEGIPLTNKIRYIPDVLRHQIDSDGSKI